MAEKTKEKKRFSLLDTVVVIAIIGILCAVLVPVIISTINKANIKVFEEKAATTLSSLQTWLESAAGEGKDLSADGENSFLTYIQEKAAGEEGLPETFYLFSAQENKIVFPEKFALQAHTEALVFCTLQDGKVTAIEAVVMTIQKRTFSGAGSLDSVIGAEKYGLAGTIPDTWTFEVETE